ncbi:MAG: valine--pyruvate transaminase [Spirochaetales bacterium]|uniref:Valine--pyruvate transaminase n=1 Tax=Candidatus Thalassospirochaeta sargassi TaxID=3119039 RepID=A0AAJ1IEU9_9SPIO|nr:valine--pyruvate transaminase [Spirochaetales bacterium]
MKFSSFGERFINDTGIKDLVDDLGKYAGIEGTCMLGGGNPALIPEVNEVWRKRMTDILENGSQYQKMMGLYGTSIGSLKFFDALAELLHNQYGWPVTGKNIAVINGSQTSCFLLYNMLAGKMADGTKGRILLPLMPEYIGYADQTIDPGSFVSFRPGINEYAPNMFKYQVDFDRIDITGVNAITASRPTNPTGNVLTDVEVGRLSELAAEHDIPLILDNAYGLPFPGIIFEDVKPVWNENIVLSMSLSKIGLPATRTGIIVAKEEMIEALSAMSAVASLAPSGVGQEIVLPMLKDGSILDISREIVMPYYRSKSEQTIKYIKERFDGIEYSIHKSEGAIFLWLWFKNLQCGSVDLYNRLKNRGVIIVPGDYFFFGLPEEDEAWEHRHQCIRVNYSGDFAEVSRGLDIIAEEVEKG